MSAIRDAVTGGAYSLDTDVNGRVRIVAGTWGVPTWDEVTNVRDVTLNMESAESDVTTRNSNGWRQTVATLKDASVEFEMVWDSADTDFIAVRDAYLNKTALDCAVLDGDVVDAGTQGLRAEFMVTSFSRSEPLEEAITVSVTLRPTYPTDPANVPEWMEVT